MPRTHCPLFEFATSSFLHVVNAYQDKVCEPLRLEIYYKYKIRTQRLEIYEKHKISAQKRSKTELFEQSYTNTEMRPGSLVFGVG